MSDVPVPVTTKVVAEGAQSAVELGTKTAFTAAQYAGGVGLAAAGSAVVSQLEYNGQKKEVANLYKEEIAAQLGKAKSKVGTKDLEKVATRNRTLSEQLVKAKQERNLNIGVIFAATLAAVGVTMAVMPATAPLLAKIVVSFLAYAVVQSPLKKIGEVLFGVDKKTTHERIEDIHKDYEAGKSISKERVFSVFVHANPDLGAFIKANYGKDYEKLKVSQKLELAESIGSQIGVSTITNDINHGRVKATELAFAVDGRFSGVVPTPVEAPKGLVTTVSDKIHEAAEMITGHPAESQSYSFAERERQRRAAAALQQQR